MKASKANAEHIGTAIPFLPDVGSQLLGALTELLWLAENGSINQIDALILKDHANRMCASGAMIREFLNNRGVAK